MNRTILAVRPEPGLSATVKAGKALGLEIIGHPLFEIRPRDWECPDPAGIDALLAGSANAFRHGGEGLVSLRGKPVHAVGKATAEAARTAGFAIASVGTGGLQNVLDRIEAPARLLRLAGEENVPLAVPDGVSIDERIVYYAAPLELPEDLLSLDEKALTVLLHSAAAARQFDHETRRLSMDRNCISLALIGPRVTQATGEGWQSIHVSPDPSDAAMLEMVRGMCI